MLTLLPAAAVATVAAAVLITTVAVQIWAAGRRIVRINRGRGRGIVARSGRYQPAHQPENELGPLVLGIMGDSLAAGLGATSAAATPSALLGQALADRHARPVRVVNVARVGSGARDLASQHQRLTKAMGPTGRAPDLVVVVTGANDVLPTPFRLKSAARTLGESVADLNGRGAHVVVATCPALAAVTALPRPARTLMHTAGLRLARLQREQAHRTGASVVVLHREVSPAIAADSTLLADDGFHPGDRGYALAADTILTALTAHPARRAEPSQNPGSGLQPLPAVQPS
ncbi:GDSL-type esterase/lipase family protein [Streptomyces griseorubiginosus]|uniref:GDSL-type esterase/lipase family protein n=1 Tax=Streptomyces griseorubiginosus TaxID=67304 RepID=UPI0036EBCA1B